MKRLKFFERPLTLASLLLLAMTACQEPLNLREDLGRPSFDLVGDPGSHFRYGTLSWEPTGNPGEVKFLLRAAFRRSSSWGPVNTGAIITETQGPTQFDFGDGNVTGTLQFLITAHSVTEDWVIGEALDPGTGNIGILHTYAGAGPFTAFLAGPANPFGGLACCRIGQVGFPTPNLNNRPGGTYPLETTVFPQSGNSSPVSSMIPVVVVPQSAMATFLVPGADANADPIQFRLSTDPEAGGGPHPGGLTINSSTGLVTWNNLGLATDFWTTQIMVEDLDGSGMVKTKTPVDFLLRIIPPGQQIGVAPSCSINPAGPQLAVVGNPVAFSVTGTDPDAGATVTLHSGSLPGGATMAPALPTSGATGVSSSFSWTPGAAQVGAHVMVFSATDENGLQGLCTTTINVILDVTPPNITLSVDQDELWPPNHKYVEITVSLSVTDNVDPNPTITAATVVSNEPDDAPGNGDGHTTGDIRITLASDGTVRLSSNAIPVVDFDDPFNDLLELRAERAGGSGGRIYTISITAEDASGNSATETVDVVVPHSSP